MVSYNLILGILKPHLHYTEKFWKRSAISTAGPTVHTNPSMKWKKVIIIIIFQDTRPLSLKSKNERKSEC